MPPSNVTPNPSNLYVDRYIVAAAATCFVWNFALTFAAEVKYIWRRSSWDLARVFFLCVRYGPMACFSYNVYVSSRPHPEFDQSICRASVVSTVIIGSAIASALHVYHSARMLELYEVKSKRLVIWGTIVLTLLSITVSCGFSVQILFRTVRYEATFETCVLGETPMPAMGIYASMLMFDLVAIAWLFYNALDQPYREKFEIVQRLRRDGLLSHTAMILLNVVMLVRFITNDPSSVLSVAILIWSLKDTVVISFILNVESVRSRLASRYTSGNPGEAYELQLQSAMLFDYHGPLSPPDSPDAAYTPPARSGQVGIDTAAPFGVGIVTTVTTTESSPV